MLAHFTMTALPRRTARQKYEDNIAALRVLQAILHEGRPATEQERRVLAMYTGWGDTEVRSRGMRGGEPLPEMLDALRWPADEPGSGVGYGIDAWGPHLWHRVDQIRRSALNAHYTPPELCAAVWAGLLRLGIGDLRSPIVLEPSAGVGRFLAAAPVDEADLVPERMLAVELDEVSAAILRAVHPRARVAHRAFEEAAPLLPDAIDVAVGNVPFGDYRVSDEALPPACRRTVHDYFVCRVVSLLRPGGVAALVTSTGTMDKKEDEVRRWLWQRADLLGAFRLPSGAHHESDVTSDVLYLRRLDRERLAGEEPPEWVSEHAEVEFPNGYGTARDSVNAYWTARPEHVLGEWCRDRLYGGWVPSAGVRRREGDPRSGAQALADAVLRLPQGVLTNPSKRAAAAPGRASVGAGDLDPATPQERALARVLRAVRACVAAPDAPGPRRLLDMAHRAYRDAHGPVRAAEQTGHPLHHHTDARWWPLVASLERADGAASTAIRPVQGAAGAPATAQDAVYYLLDRDGEFTPEAAAALVGADPAAAMRDLRGTVFQLGPGGGWATREQYLSGDVVGKLEEARRWANADPAFTVNVEALEGAQPERVRLDGGEDSAAVPLGAPWVPARVYLAFFEHLFPAYQGWGVDLAYSPETGSWSMMCANGRLQSSVENNRTYGTRRASALDLIEAALALRVPVVHDELEDGRRVRNAEETAAAQEKLAVVREKWAAWVLADEDRRRELEDEYNRRFNRVRLRAYDGSRLTFPGLATEWRGKPLVLRPHQAAGALRIMERAEPDDNVLVTYSPGLGKTLTAILGVVKRLQCGMARRAVVVVPKSVLHQWATTWREVYPHLADWVLVGTDRAFDARNRRRFLTEAALGDARVVLLTYEQFRTVPVAPETFKAYLRREVADLEAALASCGEDAPNRKNLERAFKAREKSLANFEAKYADKWAKVCKAGDADVVWEKWGVDMLVYDEVHLCKNDTFMTKMEGVSGLPRAESQRALDARIKAHYVTTPELFPGLDLQRRGKLVGLTGTPVTNSLAEAWVMMRLLQPRLLRQARLWHFDSWAGTFTTQVQQPEMDATGAWRVRTRLKFHNLPELQDLLGLAWERVDPRAAGGTRPALVGGRMRVVETEGSDELREYTGELAKRAERVRRREVEPEEDNMLAITHDGRVASIFNGRPRVSWPTDGRATKVDALVREVWDLYCHSDPAQGAQLVFCDLFTPRVVSDGEVARTGEDQRMAARARKLRALAGDAAATTAEADTARRRAEEAEAAARSGPPTPQDEFEQGGLYKVVRDRLVRAGCLPEEVAYVHDAASDAERADLFARVNRGSVRVLIGSTQRLGIGVNVQERAFAAHHLTVPWRPDWLEQANKRVDRDGNTLPEIHVVCYPTTGSYDVCLWQMIEQKADFVAAIASGTYAGRSAEDIGDLVIDATTAKAIALGDMRVVEKVKLELALGQLQRQHRVWKQEHLRARFELTDLPRQVEEKDRDLAELRALAAHRDAHQLRHFTAQLCKPAGALDGSAWDSIGDRAAADGRVHVLAESLRHRLNADGLLVGTYRGLSLVLTRDARGCHLEARHGDGASVSASNAAQRGTSPFAQIESQLASLETQAHRLAAQTEVLRSRLASLRADHAEWPHAARAAEMLARYDALCADVATAGIVDRQRFKFD